MGRLTENKTLGVIAMLVGLIGTVLSAFIYLNATHANASEFKQYKEFTVKEFTEVRIERIVNELNSISRRDAAGFMTKYDLVRKEELEREWEMLKGQKDGTGTR